MADKKRMMVTLPSAIIERLDAESKDAGLTMSVYLQMILLQHFKQSDVLLQAKGLDTLLDKLNLAQLQQMRLEENGKN